MYVLAEEPKGAGTPLAEAFNAIDQAYGTEEFSEEQAIKAIANVMDPAPLNAKTLFNGLESNDYITEV